MPLANQVDEAVRLPLGQQKHSKGIWTDKGYGGLMGGSFHLISLHINKLWCSKHAPNNSPLANNKLCFVHWMIWGCSPTGPLQLQPPPRTDLTLDWKQIGCQDMIATREARNWCFLFFFFFLSHSCCIGNFISLMFVMLDYRIISESAAKIPAYFHVTWCIIYMQRCVVQRTFGVISKVLLKWNEVNIQAINCFCRNKYEYDILSINSPGLTLFFIFWKT